MGVDWRRAWPRAAAGLLALALAGCSKTQTSPNALCDNEGTSLIAFQSDHGHPGRYEILLFDTEAGGFRGLRNAQSATASDTAVAISPDGQEVAFVRVNAGSAHIVIYERVSCSFLPTGPITSAGTETDPAFSGNSALLAFARDTLGHRRIRLAQANAGTITMVPLPGLDAPAAWDDAQPALDFTATRIAFASNREGPWHVYLYDRSSGKVDSLPAIRSGSADDLSPSLTADGHLLCFTSNRADSSAGGWDVFMYDLTTTPPTRRPLPGFNTAANERNPAIGFTGSFIAFDRDSLSGGPGRDVRLYSVSLGISSTTPFLASSGDDANPSVVLR